MKKVILSAAALMFGALSYGQVFPSAPKAQSQTTVANNSGDPQANKGKSEQFGNDQRVRVRQAGTKQSVYTMQSNGTGSGGNRAEVLQSGDNHGLSGRLNAADVYQRGTRNKSLLIQQGDKNNAITRQGMSNAGSANNKAYIRQGVGYAEDNFAAIDQDGRNNQAKTMQYWDNNDAYTDQDGNFNRSRIEQLARPENSAGHWAFVDQNDDHQTSFVLQEGDGARNYAYTAQAGLNNYADQYQTTDATSGNANRAQIAQGIDGLFSTTGFNSDIANLGSDVISLLGPSFPITVYSRDAKAFQDQNGDDNQAYIGQFGESIGSPRVGNYAEQDQTGDDNNAYLVQNWYSPSPAGANKGEQEQIGDYNDAAIIQSGRLHRASQYQRGNDNVALSSQKGLNNKAFTYQYGNDNWVSTAQNGQYNKAVVSQYGGQSYIVEQNISDGLPYGNNQVDVIQMGPAGTHFNDAAASCFIDMDTPQDWTRTPMPRTPDICTDCN
jgi:hypothetical protein